MARLSVPTRAQLPSSLRVPSSNPAVVKSLGRLSRESLISLALEWLDRASLPNAVPYLARAAPGDGHDDPDDLYPPCRSLDHLRALYTDMQAQKGAKRDVVARILEGDWRHGLTLYQLAMVDFRYLDQHPTSQRWTAYAIRPLKPPSRDADEQVLETDDKSLTIPRFHPSTFLQNLQHQVLPDVKAHYHFYRPRNLPVLLMRVFIVDSPYNTSLALAADGAAADFGSSRTVYLAFPDGSPSLYITKSRATGPVGVGESKSLHGLIVSGVPKALSRPRERFTLRPTNLRSKNLDALLDRRGAGRTNAAAGGWSIYAQKKSKRSPLESILPSPPFSKESLPSDAGRNKRHGPWATFREAKRAKLVAEARFGDSAVVTDGKGVERIEILMQDPFPASTAAGGGDDEHRPGLEPPRERGRSKLDSALRQAQADVEDADDDADASRWTPTVRLCFQGSHVFAGLRQLVEAGIVDGERMPGWMTGEEGVTTGVVRHGRIRGHNGSAL